MAKVVTRNGKFDLKALLQREADQERCTRQEKRRAQHRHWMRVMMEGQSTPDLSYQKNES